MINRAGFYSLSFVGGRYVKIPDNVEIILKNVRNDTPVSLNTNFLKYRFIADGKAGVEYYNFSITETGEYKLLIGNPERIIVKSSMLKTLQMLQHKKETSEINLLVKETLPSYKTLLSIISAIFGLALISFSVIMLIG